jgi:hypothetical protein
MTRGRLPCGGWRSGRLRRHAWRRSALAINSTWNRSQGIGSSQTTRALSAGCAGLPLGTVNRTPSRAARSGSRQLGLCTSGPFYLARKVTSRTSVAMSKPTRRQGLSTRRTAAAPSDPRASPQPPCCPHQVRGARPDEHGEPLTVDPTTGPGLWCSGSGSGRSSDGSEIHPVEKTTAETASSRCVQKNAVAGRGPSRVGDRSCR